MKNAPAFCIITFFLGVIISQGFQPTVSSWVVGLSIGALVTTIIAVACYEAGKRSQP